MNYLFFRITGCSCVFLTTACEGRLREPLDKAARRTHTQIPTFMTGKKERGHKNFSVCLYLSKGNGNWKQLKYLQKTTINQRLPPPEWWRVTLTFDGSVGPLGKDDFVESCLHSCSSFVFNTREMVRGGVEECTLSASYFLLSIFFSSSYNPSPLNKFVIDILWKKSAHHQLKIMLQK